MTARQPFERAVRMLRLRQARRLTRDLTIHVIPVPFGHTVEQAWERVATGHKLPGDRIEGWAIVTVRGLRTLEDRVIAGRLVSILPAERA